MSARPPAGRGRRRSSSCSSSGTATARTNRRVVAPCAQRLSSRAVLGDALIMPATEIRICEADWIGPRSKAAKPPTELALRADGIDLTFDTARPIMSAPIARRQRLAGRARSTARPASPPARVDRRRVGLVPTRRLNRSRPAPGQASMLLIGGISPLASTPRRSVLMLAHQQAVRATIGTAPPVAPRPDGADHVQYPTCAASRYRRRRVVGPGFVPLQRLDAIRGDRHPRRATRSASGSPPSSVGWDYPQPAGSAPGKSGRPFSTAAGPQGTP